FLHALRATAPAAVQVQVAGATAIPELLARWKVGAVVTYDNFRAGIAEHCQQRGIPCLAANPQHERTPNAVHIDDGAGVAAAAERVLAAGCQRLALCAPRVDHQSHRRRIAALERVAAAHGVPCQIAEARDFAKASADLALGGAQGCGLLVLGDWYLAATSRAGPRDRVVSIKRPWSPWIRADLVVETPWDRVAALCVKRIESQWAGGAPGRSVTIAGQLEEYSCSSDSSF
ncbi:MAG: hypothetical protein PF961_18690, partial [Planctomycetota bacterium]|nr:hypothetical protein [Planctomycetota bacterium]